jgi:hypothetical protein
MRQLANRRTLLIAATAFGLGSCASGPALTTPIMLPRTVPFAANAGATDAVRNECLLESNFAEHLRAALGSEYQTVTQAERITPTTPGRTLTARISQVQASGGGGTSFTVDGVLRDNGRVIGSFTARREKPGAASGAAGASRCGQLFQLSKQISQDIAEWARTPRMNAQLGTK